MLLGNLNAEEKNSSTNKMHFDECVNTESIDTTVRNIPKCIWFQEWINKKVIIARVMLLKIICPDDITNPPNVIQIPGVVEGLNH